MSSYILAHSTPASSPPSYNSLFGRVRTASTKLRQTPPGEKPVNPGSLYLHFCRLEKMVPTFLVVFGVFTILAYLCCTVIAQRMKSGETDDEDDIGYAFSLCYAPPSYDSLYGKIKAAHDNSDGNISFARTVCTIITSSIGFLICLGLTLSIPIVNIIIGAVFIDDCPIERFIPIYLIVGGAGYLIQNLCGMGQKIKDRGKEETEGEEEAGAAGKLKNCFNGLLSCFLSAWFIAGNVWIYSNYNDVQTVDSGLPKFCNHTLYYYAFWLTTSVYILLGVACVFVCIGCCVVCCVFKKQQQ
ncbi:hypothetical protein FSP39_005878 [Pinctada imbricata]|uniref:Uncharacterized protein n=1 Tax=Pinctada imbricata TaxID=66713 RepID=A0AA89BYV6_PINIB|nr:hypothetical protein FSP39_005878 [Pinctada imbricata]